MQAMLLLNLITPFVMILVGAILRKHPVSDMSTQNGYNTPASRKSQAHWDYAQKIAPDIYLSLGKYLLAAEVLVSIVLLVFQVSVHTAVMAGSGLGLVVLFCSFYYIDRKIAKNFAD